MKTKIQTTRNARNNGQSSNATSIFWKAFEEMLGAETMTAEIALLESIFQDTPSIEYRYLIAKFTGPWWKPFNCPLRHGKLGTLACRGDVKAIERLYNRGEITGIQIAHALIECALDPVPNPVFMISAAEKIALLQTYALETDIFCRSGNAFYPSLAWLNNRTKRAVRFFNEHARICSGDAAVGAVTATTSVAETQNQPVKWPDRLYDFNGVSTPLAYAAS